jgi:hypothetical protein
MRRVRKTARKPAKKLVARRQITHTKIEQVLGKAMVNKSFRSKLFRAPLKVGKSLGLNESGLEVLRNLDRKTFERFAKALDAKILKDAAEVIFCASY